MAARSPSEEGVAQSFPSYPVCFIAGTLITTPEGEAAIESLQPGNLVLTPNGVRAVKFVGRSVHTINALRATGAMPVEINAHAFGEGLPSAALRCTPSHAFALEDVLVQAGALLEHPAIHQHTEWPEILITYYSLELEEHTLVWANGLLAETFLPTERNGSLTRTSWTNYHEYLALYGADQPLEELSMVRIPFARQLPDSLRQRLGIPSPDQALFQLA